MGFMYTHLFDGVSEVSERSFGSCAIRTLVNYARNYDYVGVTVTLRGGES